MRQFRRLWHRLGNSGVAAIEFVFVVPVFLVLVFGIIETGRLMWYQVSMQRAAAVAARCGALNTTGCTTDLAIRNKARAAAVGIGLTTTNVSVSRISCGVRVAVSRSFKLAVPVPGLPAFTLNAQACHPILK